MRTYVFILAVLFALVIGIGAGVGLGVEMQARHEGERWNARLDRCAVPGLYLVAVDAEIAATEKYLERHGDNRYEKDKASAHRQDIENLLRDAGNRHTFLIGREQKRLAKAKMTMIDKVAAKYGPPPPTGPMPK